MATKTHILAIPYPLQGHINPMIQLCNRLSSNWIRITIITTVSVGTTLEAQTQSGSRSNLINFETVPDCTTIDSLKNLDVYEIFIRRFRAAITGGLSDIIDKHSESDNPLNAVVYDSVLPWVLDIAHAKGLKGAVLFTQPCTVCSVFYHLHKGSLEFSRDEVSLPGFPVMGVRDLPCVGCNESLLRLLVEQFLTFEQADWRLFNTFDKLEDQILKWMSDNHPIWAIGPTVPSMYTDKRIPENYDYGLNLFKPKTESWLKWLDEKEDKSVIYVSFGTLANLSENQMCELALGLMDSKSNFLWVVRDTEHSKLPQHWASGPTEKGLIVNWCTQLQVLSHRAVGCFLTHCGWNSTLEALTLGVPMVAMPHWTDQMTNAKLITDVWRIGIRIKSDEDGLVRREEVRICVNEVLRGERGDEIRRNAMKWKDFAIEAVSEGGSSDKNILEFARELMDI